MTEPRIARLGTPDMKPITVGGPSSMGQAKGGAIELLLCLIRQSICYFGGKIEQSKAQKDLKALGEKIEQDRNAHPTKGVLVTLQFIVLVASKEVAGSGNAFRYTTYLYGKGMTISEARADQFRHGVVREGTRKSEKYAYQPIWFPPKQLTGQFQRPFPVIAHGCFVEGKVWLQDVQWTTLQGFDDEGKTHLAGPGDFFYFDVLQPPKSIVTTHGSIGAVKIPIELRSVGRGSKMIPVVALDTIMGNVTAAMVFPADSHTEMEFWRAPATKQKPLGTIRGVVNFERIRWVCPENIQLV